MAGKGESKEKARCQVGQGDRKHPLKETTDSSFVLRWCYSKWFLTFSPDIEDLFLRSKDLRKEGSGICQHLPVPHRCQLNKMGLILLVPQMRMQSQRLQGLASGQ